jgi:hypothetical protein
MAIKIDQFSGKAPKVSDHLLKDNMATVATNLRIDSGAITALKGVTQVSTTTSSYRSIYRYEAPENTPNWLGWDTQNVNVIRSPVPNDRYRRIYITGNGEPKYQYFDTSLTTPAPSSEYLLGMPRPSVVPVLSESGPTSDTLTGGKTFTPGTLGLLGNATQVAGITSTAGAFVVGRYYTITSLGTTTTQANWNTIAGTTGKTYVVTPVNATDLNHFICANVGTGNGTAISSPGLQRTSTGTTWTVQGYSTLSYKDNCVLRFSISNLGLAGAVVGINTDPNLDAGFKNIDWAVYGLPNGTYQVLNSGAVVASGATFTYVSTDVFEIEYIGTTINVSKNGAIVYTTYDPVNTKKNKKVVGGQTFFMDASLQGAASGSGTFSLISNIEFGQYAITALTATVAAGNFIVGQSYKILTPGDTNFTAIGAANNVVGTQFTATGVGAGTGTATAANIFKADTIALTSNNAYTTINGTSISKTKGGTGWNTQATSSQSITGACITKFQFGSLTLPAAGGLNTAPLTKAGMNDIDFALVTTTAGLLKVYENGVFKADCGSFALTDIFQVEVTLTGNVVYSKNGLGTPLYTSETTVALTKAFYFDSSLNKVGTSITGIQLGTNLTNSDVLASAYADLTEKDRSYVYSYVSPLGEEGPPSGAVKITVNDLQVVTLTFPTSITGDVTPKLDTTTDASRPYNVTGGKRRIYRTASGTTSTEYLFVADVDITNTIFNDNLLDVALGEPMPSLNWFPPPLDMKSVTSTPNGFIVGYSGNSLCVSEAMFPHAFNPFNQLGFTGNITGIATTGDSLVVFTDDAPYLVTGSTPGTLSAIRIDHQQTCANKASIVNMGGYVLFASPDGLCSVTANDMAIETQNYLTRDQWQAYSPSTMRGYLYEGVYIGFSDTKQFMFDRRQDPAVLTDISGFTVSSGFNDLSEDQLYVLDNTGHISTWETGSNQTYIWKSKLAREATAVCPAALRLYATGDVIFKLYADGSLVFTTTVTNSSIVRLPGGYRAKEFQIEVSGSGVLQSFAIANSVSELQ